ncbi:Copper chaperone CopZ [Gammaproteobacteria bacterium]|nr:heavy-metal-associated domain-containing protein [Gammaproteobacteria bacterium]QOJ30968.1 MAG: heavy-metal-associated domain-containing protein [Gammaproteobacteria bacterium]CAG0946758.1 Copper chaperone CopZ [Gammaproteobacteria bacterium]
MEKVQLKVSGMTCGGCERSVQNALTSRKGVASARADRAAGTVSVEFDPAVIQRAALEKAITEAGFQVAA